MSFERESTPAELATRQETAPTAIVSPLAAELAAVRAATAVERQAGAFTFGRLGGQPVVLAATGDGAPAAERGLAALLDAMPVRRLLVLGVAGGLSPQLRTGDLLAARRVVSALGAGQAPSAAVAGQAMAVPDSAWLATAVAAGAVAGTALTSPRILVDPRQKAAAYADLVAALGAGGAGEPATVDLETAVYARLAAVRGIPFLAVRAVIDDAGEALPLDFNRARRGEGGVDEARVVRMALCRPQTWRALADLRRRLRRAALALARIAVRILAETGEAGGIDAMGESGSMHGVDEVLSVRGGRAAGGAR